MGEYPSLCVRNMHAVRTQCKLLANHSPWLVGNVGCCWILLNGPRHHILNLMEPSVDVLGMHHCCCVPLLRPVPCALSFLMQWCSIGMQSANLCWRAVRANKSFQTVCTVLYCIVYSCNLLPDHPGPTGQLCQPGHRRDCTAIAENLMSLAKHWFQQQQGQLTSKTASNIPHPPLVLAMPLSKLQ